MGQSNASNGAKDVDAFNEGNLEGVNIAPGDRGQYLHPDIKRKIREAQEEYDEEQKKKKNKKNRKK